MKYILKIILLFVFTKIEPMENNNNNNDNKAIQIVCRCIKCQKNLPEKCQDITQQHNQVIRYPINLKIDTVAFEGYLSNKFPTLQSTAEKTLLGNNGYNNTFRWNLAKYNPNLTGRNIFGVNLEKISDSHDALFVYLRGELDKGQENYFCLKDAYEELIAAHNKDVKNNISQTTYISKFNPLLLKLRPEKVKVMIIDFLLPQKAKENQVNKKSQVNSVLGLNSEEVTLEIFEGFSTLNREKRGQILENVKIIKNKAQIRCQENIQLADLESPYPYFSVCQFKIQKYNNYNNNQYKVLGTILEKKQK